MVIRFMVLFLKLKLKWGLFTVRDEIMVYFEAHVSTALLREEQFEMDVNN